MQARNIKKQISSSILSEEDIEELREAFQLFDRKNTGKINISELKEAMETLGFAERNPIIFQMVLELEKNQAAKKDGINFETFIDSLSNKLGDFNTKEGLMKLFELFNDDPNKKSINAETLIKIRDSLGDTSVDDLAIDDIINRVSKNGDEEINFEEFYQYMTRRVLA